MEKWQGTLFEHYLSSGCSSNIYLVIMDKNVKVGAVQAEPVWLDLEGSVDKTISLIEKASADGVQVLGFPKFGSPVIHGMIGICQPEGIICYVYMVLTPLHRQMWTSPVINNGG
jgi:hypothetical protein